MGLITYYKHFYKITVFSYITRLGSVHLRILNQTIIIDIIVDIRVIIQE